MKINLNVAIDTLIDGGASHSFMKQAIAEQLLLPINTADTKSVSIGNNEKISTLGSVSATFTWNKTAFTHKFHLLPDLPFPCILGVDFICLADLLLDIPRGKIYQRKQFEDPVHMQNAAYLCAIHGLNTSQDSQMKALISEYSSVLNDKIGCTNLMQCKLEVAGDPIAQKPYRVSPFKRQLISQHVRKMIACNIIQESKSEWASPVNLVKQNNDYRFTVDYRKINARIPSDPYAVPHMDSFFERLSTARYFSKIDLRKGYWQIPLHPDSIKYTAFICHEGKYEFLRMPFGFSNAVAEFQRFINNLLKDARGTFADPYLDDILIYSDTWEDHMKHLRFVLDRLREANLTANVEKCEFGKTTVTYLGFIISPEGLRTDPEKTKAIRDYPIPKSLDKAPSLRRFIGMCSCYRTFIPNFTRIADPLLKLLRDDTPYCWDEPQQSAFDQLKHLISHSVTLALPDFNKKFTLRTDASLTGLGAVLSQQQEDGKDRPIAFASRSLSKTERNYHATELEGLAIIWALKKFRHFLEGREFFLQTDSRALTYINSMKDVNSKFMRWALLIQDFRPIISHISGVRNAVADALSRAPVGEPEDEDPPSYESPPTDASLLTLTTVCPALSIVELSRTQQADPETQSLICALPQHFAIEDGILYKQGNSGTLLPFISRSLRPAVLEFFHDAPTAGHLGVRKTIARLFRRVFWFGMQEDIYKYIRSCKICQAVKNPNTLPPGSMQPVVPQGPWDILALDLMGPLPRTARGNIFLLVVTDHFSKWVELFGLRNATAPLVARTVEREIFCRFGAPNQLITDNATNLKGKAFGNIIQAWNIKQRFTSPYHQQANITERVNQNIRAMLSSYCNSKHNKWDEYLPETALALRTAIHDSTGFSPALLNFGREPKLPSDNVRANPSTDTDSRIEYASQLIERLSSLYAQAKINMDKARSMQKKNYDKRHTAMTFQVNDLVLVKTHVLSDKLTKVTKKLALRWEGPYKILKQETPVSYQLIKLTPGSKPETQNVKNLKPYFDRPSLSDCFTEESN